jgi:uncharacterized protein with GYD domain
MPKYMWSVRYTVEGTRGLRNDGGTTRRAIVENLIIALGGRLEAFYFAMGSVDAVAIADLPDDQAAVAVGLAVRGAGGADLTATVLMTPEEMDEATQRRADYRAPGASA